VLLRFVLAAAIGFALARPAAAQPDPDTVLRLVFPVAESGFDPVRVHDLYSNIVTEAVFERLLTYDYLARPARLVAQAAEAMPEVSDAGRTWTFRIRKGVLFQPDPAFRGKPRELTAGDFAYSLKRLADPRNRSPWKFLLDGKVVGLDDAYERARSNGDRFDYDAPIAGLETPDRHTLRIRLTRPDHNFSQVLAQPATSAVAREVIEAYRGDENAHPVGTGAYRLARWDRSNRIRLEAHAGYRGFSWDFAPGEDPRDREVVAAMRGKRMPRIGAVEIRVIEEEQSRWLAFQRGEIDVLALPATFAPVALPDGKPNAELAARGVRLDRSVDPEITYSYFNMRDPVFGGVAKEAVALRRAILMAYDVDEEIRVIHKGQAVRAEFMVPPGVVGHDPGYRDSNRFEPEVANRLLDRMGFRRGADGYRTLPDGRALVLTHFSQTAAIDREFDELWKKSLDRIGVRMQVRKEKFSELMKAEKQCLVQHRNAAWIADYPDGDNFMQLLYGRNVHESNNACFEHPEWDRLYEKSVALPPGPERDRVYRDLNRLAEVLGVWRLRVSRTRNALVQPAVQGYRKHPILHAEWLYYDLERGAAR
jgi:ABC-type oligopeptide transport system substrate-binding subunit